MERGGEDAMAMDRHARAGGRADALRARAAQLAGAIRLARALLDGGREIDLAGLEEQAGRLCAQTLDLPPAEGRALRGALIALRAEADGLIAALRRRAAAERAAAGGGG
jgi:hypothetical protein